MAKAALIDDIHDNVAARLDEVQTSLANHRKNCVALYKLHAQAAKIVEGKKLTGEVAFEDEFLSMVARVLVVKKGQTAERVVRFVGTYVKHVTTKGAPLSSELYRYDVICRYRSKGEEGNYH